MGGRARGGRLSWLCSRIESQVVGRGRWTSVAIAEWWLVKYTWRKSPRANIVHVSGRAALCSGRQTILDQQSNKW
jgi:hypothetical protein